MSLCEFEKIKIIQKNLICIVIVWIW
jgi:hypothetical protein